MGTRNNDHKRNILGKCISVIRNKNTIKTGGSACIKIHMPIQQVWK